MNGPKPKSGLRAGSRDIEKEPKLTQAGRAADRGLAHNLMIVSIYGPHLPLPNERHPAATKAPDRRDGPSLARRLRLVPGGVVR
jgi:hypothetical protein